jgi:hypothetical protein
MATLFTTIGDFRAHVGLAESFDTLDPLQADILLAEADHLQPLLGDFYNTFLALAEADYTARQRQLLYLLRSAGANLSMVSWLDIGQVTISGAGVQIISDGSAKTAFQWQIKDLKASFSRKGFNALEKVLGLLDAYPNDFPDWADSAAAVRSQELLVPSAAAFSEHVNISFSRLTYQELMPTLRKVETFALEPIIGFDFFFELKLQQARGTTTNDNRQLLERYIRPALANLTIAQAVAELGFSLNGTAFELNVYRADDANSKEADPAVAQLLELKRSAALDDGERYLRRLRTYLNANASEERYATYFLSDAYDAPGADAGTFTTATTAPIYGAF